MDLKFYITTAIAYASKKPHIGNTFEIVLADAIARFKKLQNYNVCFCTGTDEHGQKIEQIACNNKMEPQAHVDLISNEIKRIWDLMDCNYDIFIRTTNSHHVKVVQKLFKKLFDKGDIYKGHYEGFYCVACELFSTKNQLVDGKCPVCGREVSKTTEEAYFFNAKKYVDRLFEHFKANEDFITPKFYVDEIVNNFLKPGVQDFCVSRSSFKWGIPIDFDPDSVVYVWLDALVNYITALGFDLNENCSAKFNEFWPANLQVVGKDILRFHAIIWPMILMALDLPLPKQILVHQWLLCKNEKMSKTTGNVIYADDLVDLFSTDAVRFYVLRAMTSHHDGSISYEDLIDVWNLELANTLGNLVKRSCDMIFKYFDGNLVFNRDENEIDLELKSFSEQTFKKYVGLMENYNTSEAIDCVMNLVRFCNKYIDRTAPWTFAKKVELKPKLSSILFNLVEAIRFVAIMMSVFMPKTSLTILNQIGFENEGFESLEQFGRSNANLKIDKPTVLFNRIDKEKKLKEIKIFCGREFN